MPKTASGALLYSNGTAIAASSAAVNPWTCSSGLSLDMNTCKLVVLASEVDAMDFKIGDTVNVLSAFRLPKVEEVIHTGVIQRIDEREPESLTLYWVSGLAVARTRPVLRRRA